jgi:hypothetical protein
VYGSNGSVLLNSSQASVLGGGDTTYFLEESGNAMSPYGTAGDGGTVWGSDGSVALVGALASVLGSGDRTYFREEPSSKSRVYGKEFSGDATGHVTCEEEHGPGDLVRGRQASQRGIGRE